jgi:hypothetical protein
MHDEIMNFEDVELHFQRAVNFNQWWLAVSAAAESMDFFSLSLPIIKRDGTSYTLTWRDDSQTLKSDKYELLNLDIPIRDRRAGSSLNLRIEVCQNGSLESAGRRVALFTRLMEKYEIINL